MSDALINALSSFIMAIQMSVIQAGDGEMELVFLLI